MQKVQELIQDLEYEILLLESELKNCENQSLGEQLFNELVSKKIERDVIRDTEGF